VLILVHLLFFAFALIQKTLPLQDSQEYLQAADNLYHEGVLYTGDLSETIREEAYTRRPPVYPLFLGFALFTGSVFPVLLIQMLLSILAIFLVYRIFINDIKYVWLPALLLLMTPAQFIYSNQLMAEIPFQFILVLLVWCIHRYNDSLSKDRYIWLFNLLLTIGMATKPVLFPFALLWMVISVMVFIRIRKPVFLVALLLPVLWISAYTLRNYNRTGRVQYSSIQTTNLLNYNLRYFVVKSEGSEAAAEKVDGIYEKCEEESSYKLLSQCLEEGARKVIMEQPLKYAWFHLKGSFRFFFDPGRFDLVSFFHIRESDAPGFLYHLNQHGLKGISGFLKQQGPVLVGILVLIFLFKVLKIIGLLLYLFRSTQSRMIRLLLFGLVAYLALLTGPLGASRFMLPVELLIIGAAAQGWILCLFKRRQPATTYPGS
jgi:4-amino-4-deoxy-L-arabinose transferase-like glycosyltransferase